MLKQSTIGRRTYLLNKISGGPHPCHFRFAADSGHSAVRLGSPLSAGFVAKVGCGLDTRQLFDQASIDCKAFAPNQTGPNACLDHTFEHATENISLAKALVAG